MTAKHAATITTVRRFTASCVPQMKMDGEHAELDWPGHQLCDDRPTSAFANGSSGVFG